MPGGAWKTTLRVRITAAYRVVPWVGLFLQGQGLASIYKGNYLFFFFFKERNCWHCWTNFSMSLEALGVCFCQYILWRILERKGKWCQCTQMVNSQLLSTAAKNSSWLKQAASEVGNTPSGKCGDRKSLIRKIGEAPQETHKMALSPIQPYAGHFFKWRQSWYWARQSIKSLDKLFRLSTIFLTGSQVIKWHHLDRTARKYKWIGVEKSFLNMALKIQHKEKDQWIKHIKN